MALVRCSHCGKPEGRTKSYVTSVDPVGYLETAAICGRKGCTHPGKVWLTAEEYRQYQQGERIFSVPNAAVKIKVV